jgi:hypothetical protein
MTQCNVIYIAAIVSTGAGLIITDIDPAYGLSGKRADIRCRFCGGPGRSPDAERDPISFWQMVARAGVLWQST